MLTWVQWLVIGFFAAALAALVSIQVFDPALYAPVPPLALFVPVAALIAVLATGIVRLWRWVFWLILIAFAAGVLRVPASALELAGVIKSGSPAWYLILQGIVGLVQVAIAWIMWSGYRRGGYWAAPDLGSRRTRL